MLGARLEPIYRLQRLSVVVIRVVRIDAACTHWLTNSHQRSSALLLDERWHVELAIRTRRDVQNVIRLRLVLMV